MIKAPNTQVSLEWVFKKHCICFTLFIFSLFYFFLVCSLRSLAHPPIFSEIFLIDPLAGNGHQIFMAHELFFNHSFPVKTYQNEKGH